MYFSLGQDEEKLVRQSRQSAGQPYRSPGSPKHHTSGGKHFSVPDVSTSQSQGAPNQVNLEEKCKNLEAQVSVGEYLKEKCPSFISGS